MGGGCNAARGLISRDIAILFTAILCFIVTAILCFSYIKIGKSGINITVGEVFEVNLQKKVFLTEKFVIYKIESEK